MDFLQAVLLGALQGVTEFLPVSSSGHLVVAKHLLSLPEIPLLFDVILHTATLVVVIIVFRRRIGGIVATLSRWVRRKQAESDRENLRLVGVVLVATVITAAVGFSASLFEAEKYPQLVSACFIVTGVVLILARTAHGSTEYSQIGAKHGVITGLAQGLGVFPGISRAGITISAALFSGMDRRKAGEFSFLISVPAILGALVLELRDLSDLVHAVDPLMLAAGWVSAFVVGMASILLLLRLVRGGKLYLFSIYLVPLGIAGLLFL